MGLIFPDLRLRTLKKKLIKKLELRKEVKLEQKAFRQELAGKLRHARQEAYAKEAVKSAKVQAKEAAQVKFGPRQQVKPVDLPGNIFGKGDLLGFPKQQLDKKLAQKGSPKKKAPDFKEMFWEL